MQHFVTFVHCTVRAAGSLCSDSEDFFVLFLLSCGRLLGLASIFFSVARVLGFISTLYIAFERNTATLLLNTDYCVKREAYFPNSIQATIDDNTLQAKLVKDNGGKRTC